MLRIPVAAVVSAAILTSPVLAKAPPPPVPMLPAGKWSVEYARDMCVLSRMFAGGGGNIQLAIKPSPNSDQARIMLIEQGKRRASLAGDADVRLGDGSRPEYAQGYSASSGKVALTAVDLPRSALDPLDGADGSIIIRFGKDLNYHFAPGGMAPAWRALAKCERDLLKSWGMDEATQDRLAELPRDGAKGIFRSTDYPERLIDRGIQGSVGALLTVGADGRVTACRAIEPSGTPELDTHTCGIFSKRARYTPAIDRTGQPMAALLFQRVNWRIGEDWGFSLAGSGPVAPFSPPTGTAN